MANENISDLSARWFMEDNKKHYSPELYKKTDFMDDPKTYSYRRYRYGKEKISEAGTIIVSFIALHTFFIFSICLMDTGFEFFWPLFICYLPLDGIIVMILAFASSFITRRHNAKIRRKWNVDTEEDRRLDKMNDAVTLGIIAGLGHEAGKQVRSATRPHNRKA